MRQTILGSRYLLATILCGFLAVGASTINASTVINFDPDGGAAGNPTLQVSGIDFKYGNSLYRGMQSLLSDSTTSPVHYVQASVDALTDSNSNALSVPGLGTPGGFQLTMVLGFSTSASTTASNGVTLYNLAANPQVNFFRLYYNSTRTANDLAGTGFTDGAPPILTGTIESASGGFFRTTGAANTLFDQFGADDYAGLQTVQVSGGGQYKVHVLTANPAFFPNNTLPTGSDVSFVLTNSSDIDPFRQTNPSHQFFDGSAPYVPSLGPVNGQGADFQAQADANASFDVPPVVPEPSSIVLGMIGLIGLTVVARRRAT
jgi:hypothetical protein